MNDYNSITERELLELNPDLDKAAVQELVESLNDRVDELVGEEIVASLTPDDVDTLATMQNDTNEKELADWVANHVPDYPEILQNNKDIVLGEYVDSL